VDGDSGFPVEISFQNLPRRPVYPAGFAV
jgi:hypothetical protein